MVSVIKMKNDYGTKFLVEIACKSTDTKPTNYSNGSMAIEVDTGDIYIFDESTSTWNKMCSIKEA